MMCNRLNIHTVCNYWSVHARKREDRNNLDAEAVRNLQLSSITSELKVLHPSQLILMYPLNDYSKYMMGFETLRKMPPLSIRYVVVSFEQGTSAEKPIWNSLVCVGPTRSCLCRLAGIWEHARSTASWVLPETHWSNLSREGSSQLCDVLRPPMGSDALWMFKTTECLLQPWLLAMILSENSYQGLKSHFPPISGFREGPTAVRYSLMCVVPEPVSGKPALWVSKHLCIFKPVISRSWCSLPAAHNLRDFPMN